MKQYLGDSHVLTAAEAPFNYNHLLLDPSGWFHKDFTLTGTLSLLRRSPTMLVGLAMDLSMLTLQEKNKLFAIIRGAGRYNGLGRSASQVTVLLTSQFAFYKFSPCCVAKIALKEAAPGLILMFSAGTWTEDKLYPHDGGEAKKKVGELYSGNDQVPCWSRR